MLPEQLPDMDRGKQNNRNKWQDYYDRNFTPWDSEAASSHLVSALSFDRATLRAQPTADRTDQQNYSTHESETTTGSGKNFADDKPYASALREGPSIEKMLRTMEEELALLGDQSSLSKIERIEGMIKIICRDVSVATYRYFCETKPMANLEQLEERFSSLASSASAQFDADNEDVHESIRNMYSIQARERLDATWQELAEVLAIRYKERAERDGREMAAWELRKENAARAFLGPSFIVGPLLPRDSWQCLELGCGSGATSVRLSPQDIRLLPSLKAYYYNELLHYFIFVFCFLLQGFSGSAGVPCGSGGPVCRSAAQRSRACTMSASGSDTYTLRACYEYL